MLLRDLTKVYISEYKEIEDHRRNRKKVEIQRKRVVGKRNK
jgi:hypothetical protein